MSSYIDDSLTTGEQVLHRARVSVWSLTPYVLLGAVFIYPLYGLGLIFWLAAYIRYKTTELAITNKRIIAKFGFISRSVIEMNLQRTESIQVFQSIFGRLFNFGTIIISGAGNPQAPVPGIHAPMAFRRAFLDAQEKALTK